MTRPAVTVCEPHPRWAVLLRRFAPDLAVSEARSPALAEELLAAAPSSYLAIAASQATAAEAIARLAQWRRSFPEAVLAVLLDASDIDLELALREAGAQLVVASPFDLPMLARIVRRHVARNLFRASRSTD